MYCVCVYMCDMDSSIDADHTWCIVVYDTTLYSGKLPMHHLSELSIDESAYILICVVNKIKAARYHAGWTGTGETVKCLSEEILPSPDCRVTTLPTQLVFFTDGRANGCTKAADAITSLRTC